MSTDRSLWRQFLPLSLSDITMALGDPLLTITLAHLPAAQLSLAASGIAKSIAIFFESPIIMVLHASNTLGAHEASRRALWRFVLGALALTSGILFLLALPPVFALVGRKVFNIHGDLQRETGGILLMMFLWPAAIGWRRYFQGLLIRTGHDDEVGKAGIGRLLSVAAILATGYALRLPGPILTGIALMGGVLFEAGQITWAAKRHAVSRMVDDSTPAATLPVTVRQVWRFYWPLANSMLVVWGGRALLLSVIARAADAPVSLAAWPAAWGFILVIANATRMVQQVIIKNRGRLRDAVLLRFAAIVGALCSLLLLLIAATAAGRKVISLFVGNDPALVSRVVPVLWTCAAIPLIVALQNALQGFTIADGRTGTINAATWLGTVILLGIAAIGVGLGWSGSAAAAIAMLSAYAAETMWLAVGARLRTLEAKRAAVPNLAL